MILFFISFLSFYLENDINIRIFAQVELIMIDSVYLIKVERSLKF